MKKEHLLKVIGIGAMVLMIANLILFALGKINWLVFWGVIIVGALFAFKVLPKKRK